MYHSKAVTREVATCVPGALTEGELTGASTVLDRSLAIFRSLSGTCKISRSHRPKYLRSGSFSKELGDLKTVQLKIADFGLII